MIELKHPFISVLYNSQYLYGGDQDIFPDKTMHYVGCGVISAVDTFLYLHLYRAEFYTAFFNDISSNTILQSIYQAYADEMRRTYLPLIPRFGINGLSLVWGINRFIKKNMLPIKASLGAKMPLFDAIDSMLMQDIPVILSVGPNFPAFWGKNRLRFYSRNADADYVHSCSAKAHYVTVTGADENWLQISSWGKKYYINKAEYVQYTQAHSIPLLNNIVYLRRTD